LAELYEQIKQYKNKNYVYLIILHRIGPSRIGSLIPSSILDKDPSNIKISGSGITTFSLLPQVPDPGERQGGGQRQRQVPRGLLLGRRQAAGHQRQQACL
jgi:hypothetical protein